MAASQRRLSFASLSSPLILSTSHVLRVTARIQSFQLASKDRQACGMYGSVEWLLRRRCASRVRVRSVW